LQSKAAERRAARRGGARGPRAALEPVPWLAPSVLLILLVIAFPAVEMVPSSFLRITHVFNSFPIIWIITGKIPDYDTDTTITFMYKIAFGPGSQLDAGEAAALFFLAPYAVMLLGALRSDQDLFTIPARYLPARWEWSNFVEVWSQIPLLAHLRATLVIAGITTLIVLVVSLPAAWFAARHQFRGRNLFLYLILATQMFAPVALVVGLYREYALVDNLFANLGLGLRATWSYWAIILVYSAFNLAFAVWILSGYFRSIPREIEEAALIDGLGRFRVLLRVVLPLAKPGVVTALIFTFIQVWNEFVVALTVGIQQFVGLYETRYQYLFVASLIGIVPVLVLFTTIERYLMGGLTAGSVK
jgi:multiple sugar transport system permease protein